MKIGKMPEPFEKFFLEIGNLVLFARDVGRHFFSAPFEYRELVKQGYHIGNRTLPLVGITAFIMGMVLTLQSRPVLIDFGAATLLPGMVAVSIIREIGPVITALLCAGKISSGIGAELGAMKVTEQLDAMEVSGTKPLNYVVATRVLATTFLVPILVFIADAIGMLGSYISINMFEKMSFVLFLSRSFDSLEFYDIIPSTIKTIFFGFFIGLIGAYKGYSTGQGTEAVGLSANSAVVTASLAIFLIDLIAVQLSNLIYGV